MSNWEQFANCDLAKTIDPLIRIALCHYQFEAIHPFSDGNGRTGRILMVLQMVELELLQHPVLYISGFLNRHRADYYNLLRAVTDEQKWIDYLEFMILGFAEQAKKNQEKLIQMEGLYVWLKDNIREKNPKYRAQDLSDHIFSYVVTSPSKLADSIGVTYQTASRYLSKLEEDKILVSRWFGKQHLYMFPKL